METGVPPAPPALLHVPDAAVQLLERFEGCVLHPYLCPAGKPTIGIGTTTYPSGRRVDMNDAPITRDMARSFALSDLVDAAGHVAELVKVPLTEGEQAALVLFVHNGGPGMLKNSTLLRRLNGGDIGVGPEFDKFCNAHVNGVLVPQRGLRIRRRAERYLWEGMPADRAYAQALTDWPRGH